jgi:hypothetical protein
MLRIIVDTVKLKSVTQVSAKDEVIAQFFQGTLVFHPTGTAPED